MPELNRKSLEEEFNLERVDNQCMSPALSDNLEDDPDTIIRNNIDRANRILDLVERELNNGNFSARLVEVAAKTMDTITSAVSQTQSTLYNYDYLQLRQRMVKLKEIELDHKVKNLKRPNVGSQNIIFTDRETLLKSLKENNIEELEKGGEYEE